MQRSGQGGSKQFFSHLSFQESVGMGYTATEDVQAMEKLHLCRNSLENSCFLGNGLNSEAWGKVQKSEQA